RKESLGRLHPGRSAGIAHHRRRGGAAHRACRARDLRHGDRALWLQPNHRVADRRRHVQHHRGDFHRKPLRAHASRPRQRGHPAPALGASGPVLARPFHDAALGGLLPRALHPHRGVLARSVDEQLALRHGLALAHVDPASRDARRARPPRPAIRRGDHGRRDGAFAAFRHERRPEGRMSPTTAGILVLVTTILLLFSGVPVAFGLGAISIAFLAFFQGFDALHVVAETFWSGLNEFTLVSIPMFVMMGAAIGSSPAGKDLYEALDRWLYRLPGGLVISNIGACAIFAALTGSSPACCAAIGKMGIPEMRRRGYPDDVACGSICAGGTLGILIPPSVTFILYGIATETSIGRLFIAGVLPGLMLTGLFMAWTIFIIWKRGFHSHAIDFRYSWKEKFTSIPKIAPFLVIIFGVMYS